MAPKYCGDCSLCCKLIPVESLKKAHNVWCLHYAKGIGCTIYDARPDACRGWQCIWLAAAENGGDYTNPILRPDRLGVIAYPAKHKGKEALKLLVDPDRPDAWREPLVMNIIGRALGSGNVVLIVVGAQTHVAYP